VSVRSRLGPILAVARLAFRESARNRVLHALLGAMLLVTLVAHVFAWVSGDEPTRRLKVIADLSLTAIGLLGAVASIFLGTNLVYQEVERRTIYTVLARPIDRGSFLVGKFLGLLAIMGLATLVMGVAFFLSYGFGVATLPAPGVEADALPWAKLGLAILLTYVELAVVIGVAMFFSVAAHPIEGAVFAFVVVLAGHMTESLRDLAAKVLEGTGDAAPVTLTALANLLEVGYLLLPNLEHFNVRAQAVHDLSIAWQQPLLALLYAGVYTSILLALSTAVLRRKVL
jgi:ABC-type transport system involved in multi-copper enzyme maturation permease subunit